MIKGILLHDLLLLLLLLVQTDTTCVTGWLRMVNSMAAMTGAETPRPR